MNNTNHISTDKQSVVWSKSKNPSYLLSRKNLLKEFKNLKNEGLLIGDYDDLSWEVHSTTHHTILKINFFDTNDFDYINSLKAYIIFRRKQYISAKTIYSEYLVTKRLFLESRNLTALVPLIEFLNTLDKQSKVMYMSIMKIFLKFYVPNKSNILIEIQEYLQTNVPINIERNVRELPEFQDVLTFNSVILDFFKQDISMTLEYYSIYIWWKLTNVIPMRPIEFVNLDVNCLVAESTGKKMIIINRFKRKGATHNTRSIKQVLEITDEIHKIMDDFSNQLEMLGISKDKYFFPKSNLYSNLVGEYSTNENIMIQKQFSSLLGKFNQKIVLETNEVPYGFCMNKDAPFKNCVTDCRLCSYENYLFMPPINELDDGLKWLSNVHKDLDKKIDNTLELLFSCYSTFKSDVEKISTSIIDKHAQQLSMQLFSQMNQQALVLSRINQINNQLNEE